MSTADQLWPQFRRRIIDALFAVDDSTFIYINADKVLGTCPVCESSRPEYLAVEFHGRTSRADLRCSRGCAPSEIARVIRGRT